MFQTKIKISGKKEKVYADRNETAEQEKKRKEAEAKMPVHFGRLNSTQRQLMGCLPNKKAKVNAEVIRNVMREELKQFFEGYVQPLRKGLNNVKHNMETVMEVLSEVQYTVEQGRDASLVNKTFFDYTLTQKKL